MQIAPHFFYHSHPSSFLPSMPPNLHQHCRHHNSDSRILLLIVLFKSPLPYLYDVPIVERRLRLHEVFYCFLLTTQITDHYIFPSGNRSSVCIKWYSTSRAFTALAIRQLTLQLIEPFKTGLKLLWRALLHGIHPRRGSDSAPCRCPTTP